MLTSIAVTSINHMLHSESWARKRLQVYAGKTVCIRLFPFPDFSFSIKTDGEILTAPENSRADTIITLTPGLLLRIRANNSDKTDLDDIEICGDSEFAKELFTIGRYLRWDLGQDLSAIIGDIFSYRIEHTGENITHWQTENIQKLSQTLTEYLTEEQSLLTSHILINEFNREVKKLHDDAKQLEQRIQKLIHQ